MSEEQTRWAIVELMGHNTLAGRVTKDTSLFPLLRIDVPPTSTQPEFTTEYGPAAIYRITYVSEQVARLTAESIKASPITVYTPELVTREQFERMQATYRDQIAKLRGLPAPPAGTPGEGAAFDDEDDEEEGPF